MRSIYPNYFKDFENLFKRVHEIRQKQERENEQEQNTLNENERKQKMGTNFNKLFGQPFVGGFGESNVITPSMSEGVTISTDEDNRYIVEIEMPGVRKENIEIDLKDDVLKIKGVRYDNHKKVIKSYDKTFNLYNCDPDKIEATLNDGILTLVIDKYENAKPRRINIK